MEVESFEGLSVLKTAAPRVAWIDPQRLAKRLDTAVRRAARQLGPYREEAIPLLVVLDNHRRVGLPLEPIDLIQLYGSVQVHASLDTLTGTVGPPQWQHGGGQTLSPRWRTYLSAIAVNLPKKGYAHVEPANAERPMRIRLLHNPHAIVPFPPDVFIDPEDHMGRFAMGKWTWWAGA